MGIGALSAVCATLDIFLRIIPGATGIGHGQREQQALDRDVMRLASQGSTLYVLMRPDPALQSEMRTVLLQVPGVTDVHFYTE